MEAYRDLESKFYDYEIRLLGNCYTVDGINKKYYYEFDLKGNQAIVRSNDFKYIEEAIIKFREDNLYITKFKDINGSFSFEADEIYSFKLPINIIQLSNHYLNKTRLEQLKNIKLNEIYLPVTIIDDEYVLLDGAHRLYLAYQNDLKMVNVYIDKPNKFIETKVYANKEQNIKKVKDMVILNNEDYLNEMENMKIILNSLFDSNLDDFGE